MLDDAWSTWVEISIVTVCYNAEATIADCMRSVAMQQVEAEHIIVDGGSTDRTLQIISEEQAPGTKVVSEPDEGIYDAMNKGIAQATGKIIGILNADDIYADAQVLRDVLALFEREDIDSCYADLQYVRSAQVDSVVRNWVSGAYNKRRFLWGWMPPHPTFFVKAEIYERFGRFRLDMG